MTSGLMSFGRPLQTVWKPIKVGGGGFCSALDFANDGTLVSRNDTSGAYMFNSGNAAWSPIVRNDNMPAADAFQGQGVGVYELRIAPSNSNYMYMTHLGYVYVTTDKAASWTRTNVAQDLSADGNAANFGIRGMCYKTAIDPQNPLFAIVSTPAAINKTSNGGSTWTNITSSFAAPTGGNPFGYYIAFDKSSSVIGGVTQTIYVGVYGTGIYKSSNGGSTWALMSGSPPKMFTMEVDYNNGNIYATDAAANSGNGSMTSVFVYNGSSWANPVVQVSSGNGFIEGITCDPGTIGRVITYDADGNLSISLDHGATWSGKTTHTIVSTDAPWIAYTNGGSSSQSLFGSCIRFNPAGSNELWGGTGLGVVKTSPPNSATAVTWTYTIVGIEQLDGNQIIKPQGGSRTIMAAWDQGVLVSSDPTVYPTAKYTTDNTAGLCAGWDLDWSPSTPTTIVALINWPFYNQSGISLDGGATWNQFAVQPPGFGAGGSERGGCIAVNGGATLGATNIVVAGTDQGSNPNKPMYTTNGGGSWSYCSFPAAVPTTGTTGWGAAYYNNHVNFCSDRVTAGKFYAYNTNAAGSGGGSFVSTDSGATWTLSSATVFSGASSSLMQMAAVPANAGHVYLSLGKQNSTGISNNTSLQKSTDGCQNYTAVPNVADVWCMGFGKAIAGGYPAMFIVGYVSGVWGIWRSDNANQATPTWTQLGGFPLGDFDRILGIAGDLDVYGKCYVAFSGSGWGYAALV